MRRVVLPLLLIMIGCDLDDDSERLPPPPVEPASPTEPTAPPQPDADDEDEDEEDETPFGEGACARVDLLFVIDNSASMVNEQEALSASVPAFVEGIEDKLGGAIDYHVGVISTDDAPFNAPGCQRLGALVTKTAGEQSSDRYCGPYAQGGAFMTRDDDLGQAFGCAARLGTSGNDRERPMDALAEALHPQGALAGCNAGFLRDEALLVVVLITDEDDHAKSAGDPGAWQERVLAAKGGEMDNVVVLTLVELPEPNACAPAPFKERGSADRLLGFTDRFAHGFVGDVCAADYGPFFAEALDVIDTACTGTVG